MNKFKELKEKKERLEMELKQIVEQIDAEASSREDIPRMLTLREASRETGLSYNHVRSLCQTGKVVSIPAGNRILVNRDKLIAYLNSGKETSDEKSSIN